MFVTKIPLLNSYVSLFHHGTTDHISNSIAATNNFYERDTLDLLHFLPISPGTFVDIGANIGNHSLYYAKVLKKRTISFEPDPENFNLLLANRSINRTWDIHSCHKLALGDRKGKGSIEPLEALQKGMIRVSENESGSVDVDTLDAVCGNETVAYIKIDVEGAELAVLEGAHQTLSRCQPCLTIECQTIYDYMQAKEYLEPLGYRAIKITGKTPNYTFLNIRAMPEHETVLRMSFLEGNWERIAHQAHTPNSKFVAQPKSISTPITQTNNEITTTVLPAEHQDTLIGAARDTQESIEENRYHAVFKLNEFFLGHQQTLSKLFEQPYSLFFDSSLQRSEPSLKDVISVIYDHSKGTAALTRSNTIYLKFDSLVSEYDLFNLLRLCVEAYGFPKDIRGRDQNMKQNFEKELSYSFSTEEPPLKGKNKLD